MLVTWDRGLHSFKMVKAALDQQCHEKGEEVVYRLITDLMDYEMFPSLLLANEYHWRWEIENTLSEFKTHSNSRKIPICSKKSKLVVQEIYGWLLAHWAIGFYQLIF